jgi:ubiquinone/menaquinone biosynthesis C-methylase UbiE
MEPTDKNRRAFDEVHRRHGDGSAMHRGLPSPVRHALADLHGKRALQLQCGSGEAAAELAELGATVTGVDESAEALALARERWPSILWIEGNANALPRELRRGRFDLVYAGEGIVGDMQDLETWGREVAASLRDGGDLLLYDEHPVAKCVDGLMHWRENYFDDRRRRLGQIVTSLASAGLAVRALQEYPQQPANVRRHDARVPGAFLLHAVHRGGTQGSPTGPVPL